MSYHRGMINTFYIMHVQFHELCAWTCKLIKWYPDWWNGDPSNQNRDSNVPAPSPPQFNSLIHMQTFNQHRNRHFNTRNVLLQGVFYYKECFTIRNVTSLHDVILQKGQVILTLPINHLHWSQAAECGSDSQPRSCCISALPSPPCCWLCLLPGHAST